MGGGLDIVLVDTAPSDGIGSMTRYGSMVESAILERSPGAVVQRLRLALPQRTLSRFPGRWAVWVNHLWMWAVSRRVLKAAKPRVICHVLDGSCAYVARYLPGECLVVTCHDVIPYLQCCGVLPGKPGYCGRAVIRSSLNVVRRASRLTAVSGNTRKDLEGCAGVEPGRTTVVYPILNPEFRHAAVGDPVRASDRKWIVLHVGNNAGYKNRQGVVDVFAELVRRKLDVRLILAGPPLSRVLADRIRAMGLAGSIRVCEDPTDNELRRLYGECRVLLFPSLYEGFGSPVLEAMACGCPVVCSSAASLLEVTDGAALMAAAEDTDLLADHCVRVLTDDALAGKMAAMGLSRAAEFAESRMAGGLCSVYESLWREGGIHEDSD